jgi:Restriction endonuclease
MATALQNPNWFDINPDRCPSVNRPWLSGIISTWASELSKTELDKRKRGSNPPVSEKPISDKEVENFLERILNPSQLVNPRWTARPQLQGFLFQAQLGIILRYLNYDAHSRNPVGPDGGIDLEARTPEGRAVIIQVKKYATPVRKELVEEFYVASLNTTFGLVLPELWFIAPQLTDGARAFCMEKGIVPKERADLVEMVMHALKNGMKTDDLLAADPIPQI